MWKHNRRKAIPYMFAQFLLVNNIWLKNTKF